MPTPERTYTLTLTENEMARIIHALTNDAEELRSLAAEHEGPADESLAAALAEASEALRDRCRAVLEDEG